MVGKYRLLAVAVATVSLIGATAACSSDSDSGGSGSGGKGTIVFGMQGPPAAFDDLPTYLTIDALKAQGYETKVVQFASAETLTTALQSGQIDVGDVSAGTIFAAVDSGLPAKAFLSASDTAYEMVSKTGLTDCGSLDGKKVAVESTEGTTGSLVSLWFKQTCPNAKPNITILPGSNNRVAGMIADQVDASALDLQNALPLLKKYPTKFATIDSFSTSRQAAAMLFAKTDWLSKNADLVKAFTSTYVSTLQKAYADPSMLLAQAKKVITGTDDATLQAVIDQWVSQKLWDPVGGMQSSAVQDAIALYGNATKFTTVKTADQVSTTEYVSGLPSNSAS